MARKKKIAKLPAGLNLLQARYVKLFESMQTPRFNEAVKRLMKATPEELARSSQLSKGPKES